MRISDWSSDVCSSDLVPADTPAVAANANQSSASGDIIVTARKRAERLQDVPVAVSAINGQAPDEANITQVQDIQQKVPGLTMVPSDFGTNILQVVIRSEDSILGKDGTRMRRYCSRPKT